MPPASGRNGSPNSAGYWVVHHDWMSASAAARNDVVVARRLGVADVDDGRRSPAPARSPGWASPPARWWRAPWRRASVAVGGRWWPSAARWSAPAAGDGLVGCRRAIGDGAARRQRGTPRASSDTSGGSDADDACGGPCPAGSGDDPPSPVKCTAGRVLRMQRLELGDLLGLAPAHGRRVTSAPRRSCRARRRSSAMWIPPSWWADHQVDEQLVRPRRRSAARELVELRRRSPCPGICSSSVGMPIQAIAWSVVGSRSARPCRAASGSSARSRCSGRTGCAGDRHEPASMSGRDEVR